MTLTAVEARCNHLVKAQEVDSKRLFKERDWIKLNLPMILDRLDLQLLWGPRKRSSESFYLKQETGTWGNRRSKGWSLTLFDTLIRLSKYFAYVRNLMLQVTQSRESSKTKQKVKVKRNRLRISEIGWSILISGALSFLWLLNLGISNSLELLHMKNCQYLEQVWEI